MSCSTKRNVKLRSAPTGVVPRESRNTALLWAIGSAYSVAATLQWACTLSAATVRYLSGLPFALSAVVEPLAVAPTRN